MKRRITLIHDAEGEFDPEQANLTSSSVSIHSVDGARQERLTFGLEELPNEIQQVLRQCLELHIRWASERPFQAVTPFGSRVSPGLHVVLSASHTNRSQYLCPLLQKAFDTNLKCVDPETSFIQADDTPRSGALPSLQFYQILPSLDQLATYMQEKICGKQDSICQDAATLTRFADALDVDYDRISNSFVVTAYWSKPLGERGWKDTIYNRSPQKDKIDIGILAPQEPLDPDELRVGGFLAVVGRDMELKPTLFSFPSRHHPLPRTSKYRLRFLSPTGLHPTLSLSIPQSALSPPPAPSDTTCGLYSYLTLPSYLFADKYQLSTTDPLFLQSHNLRGLRHMAGEADLEAPDWITRRWGSQLLMELATPKSSEKEPKSSNADSSDDWEVTIPLHLRYLHPSPSGYRNMSAPWPIVFWACTSEDDTKMGLNPFDRTRLSWDDHFGPKTFFYQLYPSPEPVESATLVENIQVPVLRIEQKSGFMANQAKQIEFGTVSVVLVGFLWVLWKLGVVARVSGVMGNNNRNLRTQVIKSKTQ